VLSLHFRKISLHFRICRERLVRIGLHPQPATKQLILKNKYRFCRSSFAPFYGTFLSLMRVARSGDACARDVGQEDRRISLGGHFVVGAARPMQA
jgi:hypothetical protein